MKMDTLVCPRCGSALTEAHDRDTYSCEHCGITVQITGRSDEFYRSRTKEKEIEYKERMRSKEVELELLRLKQKERESRRNFIVNIFRSDVGHILVGLLIVLLLMLIMFINGGVFSKH